MGVIWTSKTRTRLPQGTPPLRSGGLRGGLTPLLAASAPGGRWGLSSKSGLVLSDVGTPAYGTDPVFGSILQPTSGNYVRISGMPNTGYPFTVAMFARKNRTNGAGASRTFAFGADDFSSYQHSFFHQDNQVCSYDTGGYSASLANLTTKWTLVVCVFESASSRSLYNVIDGVVSSANEGSLANVSPWPLKLSIGQSGWNTNEWFAGDIALPMFFAGAASAATVLELYSNPWQLFAPQRTPVFFSLPAVGASSYGLTYRRRLRVQQPQAPMASAYGRRASLLVSTGRASNIINPAEVGYVSSTDGVAVGSGGTGYVAQGTTVVPLSLKDASGAGAASIIIPAGSSFTFLLHVGITAKNGANPGFVRSGIASTGDTFCILENGIWPWIRLGPGNNVLKPAGGPQVPANFNGVIGYRVASSASAAAAWDGKIQASASHSVSTPADLIRNFGYQYDPTESVNGLYYSICWLPWAVSDAELIELTTVPGYYGTLFAPQRTPSFFGAAGGGGGTTYNISISETASASEIAGAVAAFLANISETSTASETMAMKATFGTSISETATASETVATTAVLNASIIETATASETVAAATSFVVTIGETATASETVAMALGAATFAVDISETATASETVADKVTFGASISETATASDLVSMLALFQVGISETATASETVAMQLANQTYAVSISETATASDTVVMTLPTTYAISIIETVQAGDYVSMGVPSSDFWTQVTTTQSAGWGQINNTQSSGWTIIPTT